MVSVPHVHAPTNGDPNKCFECDGPWNSIRHQPSLVAEQYQEVVSEAVRDLSEAAGVPEDLLATERASGAPFRPSGGIPPQPPQGLRLVPADARMFMCPMSAVSPNYRQCPFVAAITREGIADHLRVMHGWREDEVGGYLEDPWFSDEPSSAWKDRAFHRRYGRVMTYNLGQTPRTATDEEARRFIQERISAATPTGRLDMFFDPDVPTEALVSDTAENPPQIDLDELNQAMDAMVPAQLEALLSEWWMDLAEEEVRRVVPKAVEYGALDLIQIGQDLALTAGRTVTDEEAAEMGIYFYIRGKLARWTDAIARGDRPSDDTLHDLGVYVRMAQRVRHSGGWPGLPK